MIEKRQYLDKFISFFKKKYRYKPKNCQLFEAQKTTAFKPDDEGSENTLKKATNQYWH